MSNTGKHTGQELLRLQVGFTLVELVIVIAVLGIISVYAVMNSVSTAEVTVPSQAQKMASDIRHTQTLATTWGKSLDFTISPGSNGTYSVSCTNGGGAPCNGASSVTDPATGTSFSVSLQNGATLAGSPTTLTFNSLGKPSASASYTVTFNTTETISVSALTGNVTVSP